MKNGIYLVATPIGNLSDITLRALDVLKNADIIACEDTRVTKKLLSLLCIPTSGKTFVTMHDHNEDDVSQNLIDSAKSGHTIAYVSDAGSPLISDPGYKLSKKCHEQNVYITTIPGACAAVCALQLSGLPSNSFTFVGFIPNKDKARIDLFNKYKNNDATLIFYETANRLIKTLETAKTIFGNREISVVREITKLYEDCKTGSIQDLLNHYTENKPKGEIVLIVAPSTEESIVDYEAELKEELKKSSLKTAVKIIVEKYNINKNEVYQKALELKNV
jgi:16S rRNA (cytidine1402-2'-O)-methyltransferase